MSKLHSHRFPVIALGVAASMVIGRSAGSHGDAAWIMQNPATSYCCGPNDCQRVPKDAVRTVGQGYMVSFGTGSMVVPFERTFVSIDDDFWACIPPGGNLKCFFAPPLGA